MIRVRISLLVCGLVLSAAVCTPAKAAPPLQGGRTHVVQPGDTLGHIALRYSVSVADIVAANGLADADHIIVGQQLRVPSGKPVRPMAAEHSVQLGESLSVIAQRYQVSTADLVAANGLANPDFILVGQRLTIPGSYATPEEAQLPAPFAEVHLTPNPALQGQTVVVRARTTGVPPGETVHGTLLGQEFDLVADSIDSRQSWALVGIPAMSEPGQYALRLTAEGRGPGVRIWLTVQAGVFGTDYIQLSPETSRLLDPELIRQEWAKLNRHWSYVRPQRLWEGPFRLPVAAGTRISSPFGTRRSYNGQPARSYHEGMDFSTSAGTAVYAPAAGRVVLAEELTVRGRGILIDHGWAAVSGYFHLSSIEVEAGQQVQPGDIIGRVGSTGLSTGDHLHWEIRVRSVPVNPQQWMQGALS
jgi:murein DD-endopeptidase MepM/ murein hydrolase activator NlpD